MSKIVFEYKKGNLTIVNKLSYPEAVNERVYNSISSGMYEGFLPVSMIQKRKETRLECTIEGLIPLYEYFEGIVNRKMFLDLAYNIALFIKNCEKNMINPNNLDLQSDKIFIEPKSHAIKCVYWPIVNNQRDNPPYLFLKQLPFDIKFNQNEDTSFLVAYKAFFSGVNPFSINNFEKLLLKLQGKSITSIHAPSNILSDNSKIYNDDANKIKGQDKNIIEYDPFAEINTTQSKEEKKDMSLEKTCKICGAKNSITANFCGNCGNKLCEITNEYRTKNANEPAKSNQQEAVRADVRPVFQNQMQVKDHPMFYGETTVLGGGGNIGETTVLGATSAEVQVQPHLIRTKNNERINLNKPVFRIGKEKSYVDYFVSDNSAVSRSHCNIISRDGQYFIVDTNSTNHTYVNGGMIQSNTEVKINSGDKIRLANEDFEFKLY